MANRLRKKCTTMKREVRLLMNFWSWWAKKSDLKVSINTKLDFVTRVSITDSFILPKEISNYVMSVELLKGSDTEKIVFPGWNITFQLLSDASFFFPVVSWILSKHLSWFWILGKIIGKWPRESDFIWKKFSQEWKCNDKPEKLHCSVASNLWSGLAPDFWPWECVQDSSPVSIWSVETTWYGRSKAEPVSKAESLELGLIKGYCRLNKEPIFEKIGKRISICHHRKIVSDAKSYSKMLVMKSSKVF